MPKPSERIHEIKVDMMQRWLGQMDESERKVFETPESHAQMWTQAISQFLDEEHEKNKPCEHKEWDYLSYNTDTTKVCKDCGVLFS